jgi:hypothetical protein
MPDALYIVGFPLNDLKKATIPLTKEVGLALLDEMNNVSFAYGTCIKTLSDDADMGKNSRDHAKGLLCFIYEDKEAAMKMKNWANKKSKELKIKLVCQFIEAPVQSPDGQPIYNIHLGGYEA